ncbi:hypothetical protein KKF05_04915 [Patescibacteria group bacterium]|nr:hypothetical protein [Patescibacteria group bacterium]MBU1028893.1 hypothetical protein [Patescibacteria group bacterium]MBU1915989.1 hypothetical protein [Patescibacteria group bacterium]
MTAPKNSSAVRWADRILISGAVENEADKIRRRLAGSLSDCYGVAGQELRKTAFELQAIQQISGLLNVMANSMQLTPRGITSARVHLLQPNDYRLFLGDEDNARTVLGHTYIAHTTDKVAKMFLLTHELAHLASYLCLQVNVTPRAIHVTWKKSGYRMQGQRGNQFTGLNEAVAEIVAGLIREIIVRRSGLLNTPQKKDLTSKYLYAPQVRIVQCLVDRIAKHENCDDANALLDAIRGFLSGGVSFLRRANRAVPGAAAILRAMNNQPESVLIAAYALGMTDIYTEINDVLRSQNIFDIEI